MGRCGDVCLGSVVGRCGDGDVGTDVSFYLDLAGDVGTDRKVLQLFECVKLLSMGTCGS